MSLFIVGLDSTIVNVALPSIGRELHASVSGLQWTIDAYALVLASLLMVSGSTAARGAGADRRVRAGAGEPLDVLRVDRGPDRAPQDVPGGPGRVHGRLAAVQAGPGPGVAGRLPDGTGGRRLCG